jgi:hypothetical protein
MVHDSPGPGLLYVDAGHPFEGASPVSPVEPRIEARPYPSRARGVVLWCDLTASRRPGHLIGPRENPAPRLAHSGVHSLLRDGLRQRLVSHTRVFQSVGPLAASAGVRVFQVLPEVIRPEEFFLVIALVVFVHVDEMLQPSVPIWWRRDELLSAVAAHVRHRPFLPGCREGCLSAR